jgi:hypothetical protein
MKRRRRLLISEEPRLRLKRCWRWVFKNRKWGEQGENPASDRPRGKGSFSCDIHQRATSSAPHSLRAENSLFYKKGDNSRNGGLSENKKNWQRTHMEIIFYGRIEEEICHDVKIEAYFDSARLLLHEPLWPNVARTYWPWLPEGLSDGAEKLRNLTMKTGQHFPLLSVIVRLSSKSAGFLILGPLPWIWIYSNPIVCTCQFQGFLSDEIVIFRFRVGISSPQSNCRFPTSISHLPTHEALQPLGHLFRPIHCANRPSITSVCRFYGAVISVKD